MRPSKELKDFIQFMRGGVKCHACGKQLNKNNLEYTPKTYPVGDIVELAPTCTGCKNNGDAEA